MDAEAHHADRADVRCGGRTILVTGGAGYIGALVVRRLLDRGHSVRVVDPLLYGDYALRQVLDHPQLTLRRSDVRYSPAVEAFRGVDAAVHLGAIVGDAACALDADLTVKTNVVGTRIVAEHCLRLGVPRLVFASTCSVYGASDDILDEESPLAPVSLYAESKIAAEQDLLALAGETFAPVILRFATAYGHSHRPRFDLAVNLLTARATYGEPVTIHGGQQWRPFVHVDDIARAIVQAVEAPHTSVAAQIFNVGSNEQNLRLSDVGSLIQTAIPSATVVTSAAITDQRNYHVRFDKIHDVLGFQPIHTIYSGILDLQAILQSGVLAHYSCQQYDNYRSLRDLLLQRTWRQERDSKSPATAETAMTGVESMV